MSLLTREQILEAFSRLDERLGQKSVHAEIYVVGGAAMCVALEARPSTKDVDAFFTEPQEVRKAAKAVAEELGFADDWLNDAAKAFVPEDARFERYRSWQFVDVSFADERTLLAMKCAAARTEEDRKDIVFLASRLGLRTADDVLAVVLQYYARERLPVRTELLVQEIFDEGP
ncbi:MAG: hypothetical protein HY898_00745 [Deltaproteobacteria bacterium]|nr:hypothetical protein [Deltaproteobacteria bacterium]